MTMTHVIKLNGRVFNIESQDTNWKLRCQDGRRCYTNMKSILHRDDRGRIQSEPILSK